MIVALAGGVGASKFLRGLVQALPPEDVTIVVNTADDIELHGLWVSPDLDTVTYTLAGVSDREQGWGLAGETWSCAESMDRYGMPTWFRLGDHDIGTHLFRTERLRAGATLTEVTAEITAAWGLAPRILPMSDDRVTNTIVCDVDGAGVPMHFQEYLVRRRMADPVLEVRYDGIGSAAPGPGVVDALATARGIVVCPSNPVVSIEPILALAGVREAVAGRKVRCVGVSPIVDGAPVRGPADRLLPAVGLEVSCAGVAQGYAGLLDSLVIDVADAGRARDVEATGIEAVVEDTMMVDDDVATALAHTVLEHLEL
ncbi:MAG: 2-phospho-L-lactate transferase [Acidimicrobiia bacterium]|nr:2-phospho-L-lactate transferase [Acidimicrobiia bacterium]